MFLSTRPNDKDNTRKRFGKKYRQGFLNSLFTTLLSPVMVLGARSIKSAPASEPPTKAIQDQVEGDCIVQLRNGLRRGRCQGTPIPWLPKRISCRLAGGGDEWQTGDLRVGAFFRQMEQPRACYVAVNPPAFIISL